MREKVALAAARGESIDYLTFVPDGEPALDLYLGDMLAALKPLGIPLAVITNSSLLGDEAVRKALGLADWVSLKMDAAAAAVWRQIDRPYGWLRLGYSRWGIRLCRRFRRHPGHRDNAGERHE